MARPGLQNMNDDRDDDKIRPPSRTVTITGLATNKRTRTNRVSTCTE